MDNMDIRMIAASCIVAAAFIAGTPAVGQYKLTEVKKDHYRAGVKCRAEVRTGRLERVRVYVVARPGWKVNKKFPFQVRVTPPDGVSMDETVFKKDDALEMSERKVVFKPSYRAVKQGTLTFKATIRLSVCRGKERCIVRSETLRWTVTSVRDPSGS